MSDGFESFDDDAPIELPEGGVEPKEPETPEEDTFDNGYYPDESKLNNQTDALEDQTPDTDGAKKADEPKSDDKSDNKKDEEKEDKKPESEEKKEEKSTEQEKKVGKTVRFKDNGKDVDVSPEATIKVKVKGKSEFVPLSELTANYSGKQAWSDKISDANSRMEEAESKMNTYKEEKQILVGHLDKVVELLDSKESNPLDALNYLLDLTGRDTHTYNKRVHDFMEEKIQTLSGMDDVEKELYWKNQRLESLERNQAAKDAQLKDEETQRELIAKVDRLRESHGVSEEQYIQAHKEMTDAGYEDLKPEQVVNFQVMKPHVEKALDLTEQFEESLGDDDMDALVHETAMTLKDYPKVSEERALIIAAEKLGFDVETVEDDVDDLMDKLGDDKSVADAPNLKAGKKLDEGQIESFDDFEEY